MILFSHIDKRKNTLVKIKVCNSTNRDNQNDYNCKEKKNY